MPEFFSNTIQAHIAALDEEAGEYKFLLLRRSADRKLYPCMWQAVTGIIEPREKAVDAAVREIGEETGLEILKLWTIPYVTTFFDPYSDRINASPVFGALTEFEREIRISEEHMD
ncbi:MAG: NUDIX domain-containing protein, partial [Bacteroidota bacterium]